jgi:hypothetical protein
VVTLGGGFGVAEARSRQVILMDLADPAHPAQLPSIAVGASTSHAGDLCAADGKTYGIVGNVDDNVTLIDASARTLLRTIPTKNQPLTLGAFSVADGPSHQTGPIE